MCKRSINNFIQIIKLCIICSFFIFIKHSYTQNEDIDYKNWKHFEIFCAAKYDSIFNQIQNILEFENKYEFYKLRIDIRSPIEIEQFIYLEGDYFEQPKRRKWNWMSLPLSYRNYLIGYKPDTILKKKLPD